MAFGVEARMGGNRLLLFGSPQICAFGKAEDSTERSSIDFLRCRDRRRFANHYLLQLVVDAAQSLFRAEPTVERLILGLGRRVAFARGAR